MSTSTDPVAELRAAVAAAAAELSGNGASKSFSFDRPPKPDFGDYSTNAAMLLAPTMGEQPRAVAERLGGLVEQKLAGELDRVDVAGPGFLNLFMSDAWWRDSLTAALAAGEGFGGGTVDTAERILVEFVSANPTGPATVASARHAAYGDALSRILAFAGHEIETEYYVNDTGGQVRRFGESIQARARGEEPPEDGYRGDYVSELAQRIEGAADADPEELARRGVELMIEGVQATLERFGVSMDRFFFEHTRARAEGDRARARPARRAWPPLRARGRPLAAHHRASATTRTACCAAQPASTRTSPPTSPTTRTSASAATTGLIDIWGADHHGYMNRMLAAWEALGGQRDRLELVIMQLVNLVERRPAGADVQAPGRVRARSTT